MMTQLKNKKMLHAFPKALLVTQLSLLCSGLLISASVNSSDIDIYQKAKEGDRTLMFMIDVSTSMDRSVDTAYFTGYACDLPTLVKDTSNAQKELKQISHGTNQAFKTTLERVYCLGSNNLKYYDRITRVKDAMIDVLLGNTDKKVNALDGKYMIGLSTLGSVKVNGGTVLVPARALNTIVDSSTGKTHRDVMVEEVAKLKGVSATPTARSYAEVASYLLGTNTNARPLLRNYYQSLGNRFIVLGADPWSCKVPLTNTANDYRTYKATHGPMAGQNIDIAWCQDAPNITWNPKSSNYVPSLVQLSYSDTRELWFDPTPRPRDIIATISGFPYSVDASKVSDKTKYLNPTSISKQLNYSNTEKSCNGQAIYMLTDGEPNNGRDSLPLMQSALGDNSSEISCSDSETGSECSLKMAEILANPNRNPSKVSIKTAMVGFGNDFNGIPSSIKTEVEVDAVSGVSESVKNAAKLGIRGQGGWYSGNKSEDIVSSIQALIDSISADIPSVTTGAPTVAKDSLNPAVIQPIAYYPQFQPTPDQKYQLWIGNLKKYNIGADGQLKDKNNNKILDLNGNLVDNFDLWSKAVNPAVEGAEENTIGSRKFSLKGGVWSQLNLKLNGSNVENRKVLTNRVVSSTDASSFIGGTTLRQVRVSDLNGSDSKYKTDPNRGYLISLLGYALNKTIPSSAAELTAAPELRQIGAVMHSSPILLTNKGTVEYNITSKSLTSKDREDYVLFGTTQGVLHVVNEKTGEEKFAFVPNEMVENQKEAFLTPDQSSGGTEQLFYGIDGPWTAYTEYVVASTEGLTVAKGKQDQTGKQMVYGGLRMGGRSYYALDLANMDEPKLQFHISPADQKVYYNGSSKSFAQLQYMGQSWSKPAIGWVKWGSSRKRVMFVGGGYDAGGSDGDARTNGVKGQYAGYESDSYNPSFAQGGGVYMFDAENGDLLWWASSQATTSDKATTSGVIATQDQQLKYSVVSEIRLEDRNSDGLTDHLYFGDLGGQVFRMDINNNATAIGGFLNKSQRILNLNSGATSPRFYEMPSFSIYDAAGKSFAVISIGSGNRSLPLQEYAANTAGRDYDAIYNIFDKDVTAPSLYATNHTFENTAAKADLVELTQQDRIDNTVPKTSYTSRGWYYKFKNGAAMQSAKVISSPIVTNYRMYVSTFDGSKAGLGGACGAGVKGESFLQTFCMPFGQCLKSASGTSGNDGSPVPPPIECTTGDGCSIGVGVQTTTVVPIKCEGESCTSNGSTPNSSTSGNANYCLDTGQIGLSHKAGTTGKNNTKMCLVPQRWYQAFR